MVIFPKNQKTKFWRKYKYIEPIFFHYKNDASNVAAWRKDINNFKNFIIRLPRLVKFRFNIAQNIISVGGEIIKKQNIKTPGFLGPEAKILIREKKFGYVDKTGTLYINISNLPLKVATQVIKSCGVETSS